MPDGADRTGTRDIVLSVLTTDDLHAYMDGELCAELVPEIEQLLVEDPRAAQWLTSYRHQIACMQKAFADGADDVPERLCAMVRACVGNATEERHAPPKNN